MVNAYPRPRSRPYNRARTTNGGEILPGIDGRSRWARRLHDLIANHVEDMGGPTAVTQAQYILIKSAANMVIVLEQMEVEFAKEGTTSLAGIISYQTVVNSLRRVFETLGIEARGYAGNSPRALAEYDMGKLTADEQHAVQRLNHRIEVFGMGALTEDEVERFLDLLRKSAINPAKAPREIAHAKR